MSVQVDFQQILQAHEIYCQLTGPKLRLDYLRERQWYDLLHQGFTLSQALDHLQKLKQTLR